MATHVSETPATHFLRQHGIDFSEHPYACEEHGGTSPFATRRLMPVYVERSIPDLEKIDIDGGRRGYLVGIAPQSLTALLKVLPVAIFHPVRSFEGTA